MTPYHPRDYAVAAINAIVEAFKSHRSALAVMATGTGKTEVFLQVAEQFLRENPLRCLVVAHREELITQPATRWRRNLDEWPAIEMGDMRVDLEMDSDLFGYAPANKRIVIASVPTLNSGKRCTRCTADCQNCNKLGKLLVKCGCTNGCEECRGKGMRKIRCRECEGDGWICTVDDCEVCFEHFARRMQKFNPQEFGLLVVDEAHHAVADSYTRLIRYFRQGNPDLKLLGLTATPDRADEAALVQIFETVAFEYSLPQPILDGWLVPVEQMVVVVDELNLANVRTTGGDFNLADLEAEMLAEKVLHKVTTPAMEVACGLEPGTIDQLLKNNRLADLPSLCTKSEPTLVHAVDVAHAERMTEIINRYLPDSALCIIGTTPKDLRREGLKRFAEGHFQFLLSCGVFLEGTDLPSVSIVIVARPTKSRGLQAQMLGRGLRAEPGLVDGVESASERVRKIAFSKKPRCLAMDFVGNAGRHKLITSADILGNELPDELVDRVIRKAAKSGQPVDILRALMEEKDKEERQRHEQARLDALAREKQQEEAKQRAAERRAGIVAGATYTINSINPFDVMDLAPRREPGWHKGRKPSEGMKETLRKAKVPFTEATSFWEAHLLIDEVFRRRKAGLCTFSQANWLTAHGYPPETTFAECRRIMDAWAKNNWKRPEGM